MVLNQRNAPSPPFPASAGGPGRALLIAITSLLPAIACADPFPTRDQNPLLAVFGLPMPMPARMPDTGDWRIGADLNWGNSAIVQNDATEDLTVDAETRELRLTFARTISRHWVARIDVPYRYVGAGNLDSFIDSWHDFFGLPEGMRPALPRDQLRIAYTHEGTTLIDMGSNAQGLGDVTLAAGYRWIADDRGAVTAWLNVKVPTGDADKLTGSDATDVSLILAGEHRLAERWEVFGQLAATRLGRGSVLVDRQRDLVGSGFAGISYNAWRGLDLKVQFDAHTAAFDSDLDYLGPAGVLTLGGSYRFASGWQFDFGVSEDVVIDASPDVVLVFELRRHGI